MKSRYVPAHAVARAHPEPAERSLRERLLRLALLTTLLAGAALAQQSSADGFDTTLSNANSGTGGESAAGTFSATGTFEQAGGTAIGNSFSLTTGMMPAMQAPSGAAANEIFFNGFD